MNAWERVPALVVPTAVRYSPPRTPQQTVRRVPQDPSRNAVGTTAQQGRSALGLLRELPLECGNDATLQCVKPT
jgi:hypothetical protein